MRNEEGRKDHEVKLQEEEGQRRAQKVKLQEEGRKLLAQEEEREREPRPAEEEDRSQRSVRWRRSCDGSCGGRKGGGSCRRRWTISSP